MKPVETSPTSCLERAEVAVDQAEAGELAQRIDLDLLERQLEIVVIGRRDGRDAGERHPVERPVDLRRPLLRGAQRASRYLMPRKPSAVPSAASGRTSSHGSTGLFEVIWIECSMPFAFSDQNTSLNAPGT